MAALSDGASTLRAEGHRGGAGIPASFRRSSPGTVNIVKVSPRATVWHIVNTAHGEPLVLCGVRAQFADDLVVECGVDAHVISQSGTIVCSRCRRVLKEKQ